MVNSLQELDGPGKYFRTQQLEFDICCFFNTKAGARQKGFNFWAQHSFCFFKEHGTRLVLVKNLLSA
jgi:hypothetical protein